MFYPSVLDPAVTCTNHLTIFVTFEAFEFHIEGVVPPWELFALEHDTHLRCPVNQLLQLEPLQLKPP